MSSEEEPACGRLEELKLSLFHVDATRDPQEKTRKGMTIPYARTRHAL